MEGSQQKPRRMFTPEQKYEIIKDIERYPTIREGLAKHGINSGLFYKWKRQLQVGIHASLRNTKPLKSPDLKKVEDENRKLKELVLNQSLTIMNVKKEMNVDEDRGDSWKNRKRASSNLSKIRRLRDRV